MGVLDLCEAQVRDYSGVACKSCNRLKVIPILHFRTRRLQKTRYSFIPPVQKGTNERLYLNMGNQMAFSLWESLDLALRTW